MKLSIFLTLVLSTTFLSASTNMQLPQLFNCNNFLVDINKKDPFSFSNAEVDKEKSCLTFMEIVQNRYNEKIDNAIYKKALLIREKYKNADQQQVSFLK